MLAILTAFLIVTAVRAWVVDVYTIPTASMEPALKPGDRVLVLTWPFQRSTEPGDVVVFDGRGYLAPSSASPLEDAALWAIGRSGDSVFAKRAMAVGGQRISCDGRRGSLLLDGRRAPLAGSEDCGRIRFDAVIPPERLWLMGDNRAHSHDSRDLLGVPGGGAIPEERMLGRMIWVF